MFVSKTWNKIQFGVSKKLPQFGPKQIQPQYVWQPPPPANIKRFLPKVWPIPPPYQLTL